MCYRALISLLLVISSCFSPVSCLISFLILPFAPILEYVLYLLSIPLTTWTANSTKHTGVKPPSPQHSLVLAHAPQYAHKWALRYRGKKQKETSVERPSSHHKGTAVRSFGFQYVNYTGIKINLKKRKYTNQKKSLRFQSIKYLFQLFDPRY